MPQSPKRFGQTTTDRKPWQHSGPDKRAGFRGAKRQEAKRRVLIRDDGQCQKCGKVVEMYDSILDHIVPISRGGGHDDGNLQTLCRQCSKNKTASESRDGRAR